MVQIALKLNAQLARAIRLAILQLTAPRQIADPMAVSVLYVQTVTTPEPVRPHVFKARVVLAVSERTAQLAPHIQLASHKTIAHTLLMDAQGLIAQQHLAQLVLPATKRASIQLVVLTVRNQIAVFARCSHLV